MHATAGAWSRVVGIALIGTAAASVASLLAPLGWPFELFAHFRWQLGTAALALLLFSLLLRQRSLMVSAVVVLALQWLPGVTLAGRATAHATPGRCESQELRVASANVRFNNADHEALLRWLEQGHADVVALQEVTKAWAEALEPLARTYPYRKILSREDPYGIALLSRWPFEKVEDMDFAGDGLPSVVATIDVRGRPLQVIALHTHWPVLPGLQVARDRVLSNAAGIAHSRPGSTLLLGDLNLTPYAPAFARLVSESGLRDAFDDQAWRPTWQAGFWPLALPLDHVLVPPGSCVEARQIGPDVGSDHRPVQVTLRLPPG